MEIKPLRPDLLRFLKTHNLAKKFDKQAKLFCQNPRYPSLNLERLEPKQFRIYSFRIDRKYRAIFVFKSSDTIEIVDINLHYH